MIYFDNASTSFPKAPGVGRAMSDIITNGAFNINRGTYAKAYALESIVMDTRERLCTLFNGYGAKNVIFTPSVTYSLNVLLKGFLKPGDHVITSSMEHNAVMRPLTQLVQRGIEVSFVRANADGVLDMSSFEGLIRPNTRAVVMLHGSNVCGTLLPIESIGKVCFENNIRFIVDSAQTAGIFPIDVKRMHIDALAFTGHKSLLGPQGIGGFLISDDFASEVTPLISGGTGSASASEDMPPYLPDKFESGTMNIPGIVGLNAALEFVINDKYKRLTKELDLTAQFIWGLDNVPLVRRIGLASMENRAAIVSVDFLSRDNATAAYELDDEYGIMTRCGLHCAPRAHKSLSTFPQGTVRFSFSHFNTNDEVELTLAAIAAIANRK